MSTDHPNVGAAEQDLPHGIMLAVGWVGFQHLSLWALLVRNRSRLAIYMHAAMMSVNVLLTAIGTAQIITAKGLDVIWKNWYHTILGSVDVVLMLAVAVLGAVAYFKESCPHTSPYCLTWWKKMHIVMGWLVIAGSRIAMFDEWITKIPSLFLILILTDPLIFALYFRLKFSLARMESVSIFESPQNKGSGVWARNVRTWEDLEVWGQDYYIFADYVYRLSPLLTSHPGGYQIIDKMRGREVDRFLYGMEPLEVFNQGSPVSHTEDSMLLAGAPLARIEPCNLYPNMPEMSPALVSTINFYQSDKRIYCVYLQPVSDNVREFCYTGYTDIAQLGKYFAVTLQNKKTRLYTLVNFLQPKSIDLMEEASRGQAFDEQERKMLDKNLPGLAEGGLYQTIHEWAEGLALSSIPKISKINDSPQEHGNQKSLDEQSQSSLLRSIQKNTIPLLVKMYEDGQFTPAFLNAEYDVSVTISRPRGRGLALQDLHPDGPKKLVFFSGGTGIYPYADTIDLLFKSLLVEQGDKLRDRIISLDPLLASNPFAGFEFTFYTSVVCVQELHPITLFQSEFLALHGRIKFYLRSQKLEDFQLLAKRYPHLHKNQSRFEQVVSQLKPEETARVFICGPTRLTKAILEELERLNWSPKKHMVL